MAASFLKSRQTRYTAYAGAYILVILAVLGAINFLANRYDKSYDSTSNKQFSLSDQTIKVVGNLKSDVKLTYFDEATRFPQARDLLARYTALSTKLKVEFIDPTKKQHEAKSAGARLGGGRGHRFVTDEGVGGTEKLQPPPHQFHPQGARPRKAAGHRPGAGP